MIPNTKKIYLCSPDRKPRTVLNGLRTETVDYHTQIKGYSELSFTVDRFVSINGRKQESNGYEDLKPYMYIYLEDIGYFQIQAPMITNDGNGEYKDVTAYSAEKEFENKDWRGIKINTGDIDSIEYLYSDNIDVQGFAKRYVVMYDPKDTRFSFLHLILEKMAYWKIGRIDAQIANAKIPSMDIDNENLYAIMTSEVAPRLQCLFVFDFKEFTVSVYHKDRINSNQYNTGIFIGLRNLAKTVDISVDQDSIYTRFSVAGADGLNIRYQNYGNDQIYNLNYFMGEPYMEEELAEKLRQLARIQEENKPDYIELAKEASQLQEKIDELTYTVPSDELYWKNWDSMSKEGLQENLKYFNDLLQAFQIAVDDRPNEEKFSNYGEENETYNPILDSEGEVDHDYYLQILYDNLGKYTGYYTYLEIHKYIIPYIELALENNQHVQNGEETLDPVEDLEMEDPLENWDLYGYKELDAVRTSYEEDLMTKLAKYDEDWDEMDEEERKEKGLNYGSREDYEASIQRKQYLHYKECLGDKDNPTPGTIYYRLNELETQINDAQATLTEIEQTLAQYNDLMRLELTEEEWESKVNPYEPVPFAKLPTETVSDRRDVLLTQDEIDLVNALFHDTDYTNSNILTTSLDTPYTAIDKEKELYDDASDKLAEVSQPQYNFSVSLDNLLRITKYEGWYDDFKLLKFIFLGIRDDYSIKLRIIGFRWNPCEITPDLQIEFSNMITSKSGRSDLVQLLELENNVGSKNSISVGLGNSNSDKEYIASLVNVLAKNTVFTQAVQNIAENTTGQIDAVAVSNIVSDYVGTLNLDANSINVTHITGTRAEFEEVFTEYLSTNVVFSKFAKFDEMIADEAEITNLSTKLITFGEDAVTEITGEYLKTAEISADNITVTNAFVEDVLQVGTTGITQIANDTITTENIVGKLAELDQTQTRTLSSQLVTSENVIAQLVNAQQGDFDALTANTAFMKYLEANLVTAGTIQVDDLQAKMAQIDLLNSQYLTANSAFIQSLQTFASTSATTVIDDAYIQSAVVGKVSVGDLTAGNIILTNNMKILSQNGAMVMDGTALQIKGTDSEGHEYTGIQLGYDANSNPSLILRNESGATVLTPSGITENAIADQLIKNDMIKNGTITENKLGFRVLKEGSDISIEQIMTGNGRFGAEWNNFKSGTNTALDDLRTDLANKGTYTLHIETPDGTNVSGGSIQLGVKLLKNNVDVTDEFDPSCFIWTRTSMDTSGDTLWNNQHSSGSKTISITSNDINIRADFQCMFNYEEEEEEEPEENEP